MSCCDPTTVTLPSPDCDDITLPSWCSWGTCWSVCTKMNVNSARTIIAVYTKTVFAKTISNPPPPPKKRGIVHLTCLLEGLVQRLFNTEESWTGIQSDREKYATALVLKVERSLFRVSFTWKHEVADLSTLLEERWVLHEGYHGENCSRVMVQTTASHQRQCRGPRSRCSPNGRSYTAGNLCQPQTPAPARPSSPCCSPLSGPMWWGTHCRQAWHTGTEHETWRECDERERDREWGRKEMGVGGREMAWTVREKRRVEGVNMIEWRENEGGWESEKSEIEGEIEREGGGGRERDGDRGWGWEEWGGRLRKEGGEREEGRDREGEKGGRVVREKREGMREGMREEKEKKTESGISALLNTSAYKTEKSHTHTHRITNTHTHTYTHCMTQLSCNTTISLSLSFSHTHTHTHTHTHIHTHKHTHHPTSTCPQQPKPWSQCHPCW